MEEFLTAVIAAMIAGAAGVWFGYGRGCVVGVESVMLGFESVITEGAKRQPALHLKVPDQKGLELGRALGERYRTAISQIRDVTH